MPAVIPIEGSLRAGRPHHAAKIQVHVHARDGGEAGRQDGAGEGKEGAELVDVEGVPGVEHTRGFLVDLPAGFQQRHVRVGDAAERGVQRHAGRGAAVAGEIGRGAKAAAGVGDAAGDLDQVDDGAAEDVGVDFQAELQGQTGKQSAVQLRCGGGGR